MSRSHFTTGAQCRPPVHHGYRRDSGSCSSCAHGASSRQPERSTRTPSRPSYACMQDHRTRHTWPRTPHIHHMDPSQRLPRPLLPCRHNPQLAPPRRPARHSRRTPCGQNEGMCSGFGICLSRCRWLSLPTFLYHDVSA